MRGRLPKVTIGRQMLIVALACVALAMVRAYSILGLYTGGCLILAVDQLLCQLDRHRASGRALTTSQVAWITLGSVGYGAVIACIPLVAFVIVFAVIYVLSQGHLYPGPDILFLTSVPSIFAGGWIASLVGQALQGSKPSTRGAKKTGPPPLD